MHRIYGRRKRTLFADLPRRVVELGPGAGANLRYYPPGTELVAIEPNDLMHARLARHAEERGVDVDVRAERAEALPLDDASVDAVVCTLVLCSVEDPRQVIAEVRRVLKPGGHFHFIEHVRAPEGSGLARLPWLLHVPWRWCFEGCVLRRATGALIREGGFAGVTLEEFRVVGPWAPFAPHVAGTAVR
jgi:ubiquinone/menaquinone biosynthesis C-methylase UbiE